MSTDDDSPPRQIHLTIPPRLYIVPGAALLVGSCIGIVRGSRRASLRFLAENAHRPPTTIRGWYLYNKTKNYKVLLGGLKAGGADASRLAATAFGWVSVEEGLERAGFGDFREVGAGVGTAGVFSAVCEWRRYVGMQDDALMCLIRPITIEGHWADFGVRVDDREHDVAVEVGARPIAGTEGRARRGHASTEGGKCR
jgi:hypothetical protein